MSKDFYWSISLGLFFILWLFIPSYRILFSIALLLHIPIFVWGIIDLRNCFFCKALFHKKNDKGYLALTFDDGPDPECTLDVLNLLDKYSFKATFFIIAERAQKYPHLCTEIIRRGHTIGCHDLNHSLTTNFRMSRIMIKEIGESQTIIKSIIGRAPLLYRPPVGLSNPHLRRALNVLNMHCIGWSSSVGDAGNRRFHTFKHFHLMARSGSVILLHDVFPKVQYKELYFKELEKLFGNIKSNKLRSITVDALFSIQAYND